MSQVILAEDEAQLRSLISSMLAEKGVKVREAADGIEALQLLKDNPTVALLLSDIVMPRMDGRALQRAGRQRFPKVPILLMSGYEADSTREEGPILKKPFTAVELARAVREALDRAAAVT